MLLHTIPGPSETGEEKEEKKKKSEPVIEASAEDLENLFKDFKG